MDSRFYSDMMKGWTTVLILSLVLMFLGGVLVGGGIVWFLLVI